MVEFMIKGSFTESRMSRRQGGPLYDDRLGPHYANDMVDPGGPADDGGGAEDLAVTGRRGNRWISR